MAKEHVRYFLDAEFMESPGQLELLSVALVCQDGREFYAMNDNADHRHANAWVQANVIPQLYDPGYACMPYEEIGAQIRQFIGDDIPEFWGYYADYDWVAFCWLFGAMVDLPKNWPMYCRDLKQWCDMLSNPELPLPPVNEHHALADARWNRDVFDFLSTRVLITK